MPTWRLGYWMWILRSARSMKTTKAITATTITMMPTITAGLSAPVRPWVKNCASAAGSSATMPVKMMSEMPLPMPRAVICSPSHIRNIVPPTSVMMTPRRKNQPGSCAMPSASRPSARP